MDYAIAGLYLIVHICLGLKALNAIIFLSEMGNVHTSYQFREECISKRELDYISAALLSEELSQIY
jgi:hypothetical protein